MQCVNIIFGSIKRDDWVTQVIQYTANWWDDSPFLTIKKSIGKVPWSIKNFCLTQPITHSTWMHSFAIMRVFSTSNADSWDFLLVKAGICSDACIIPTGSLILNLCQLRQHHLHGSNFHSFQSSLYHLLFLPMNLTQMKSHFVVWLLKQFGSIFMNVVRPCYGHCF